MPGLPGLFVLEAILLQNQSQPQFIPTITPPTSAEVPHSTSILDFIGFDTQRLADRLNLPKSWVASHSGTKAKDRIPHFDLGRHDCFAWGSPQLASWIVAHRVAANHDTCVLDDQLIFKFVWYDSKQLAEHLGMPETWVREYVRKRITDPIPHYQFGKYVRFAWGSPELAGWLERRMVVANNRKVERAQRKETIQ